MTKAELHEHLKDRADSARDAALYAEEAGLTDESERLRAVAEALDGHRAANVEPGKVNA